VWDYLVIYVEDSHLLMDNGPAENAIRPVAIGRKNFLFCDSVEGAETTAVLYSVIETAKAHGFDPFAYLRIVIERLTVARTIEDVEALLPWNIRDLTSIRQPDQNTLVS
jgi:transposase